MPSRMQEWNLGSFAPVLMALALAACSSAPQLPPASSQQAAVSKPGQSKPALPRAGSGRGAYYLDDGPGDDIPDGLLDLPDAEPQVEPYGTRGNRPYVVFGKQYVPFTDERAFKQRGRGSWYGKKFHGQRTSSGELYDMYKMTAAHPTLPLPSYARVTNVANGRQVIVRVNDRGPFHSGRIIDLSYTAALKLGYLEHGSAELEVERLLPDEIARINSERREQMARAEQVPLPSAAATPAVAEGPRGQDARRGGVSVTPVAAVSPAGAASGFYLQLGAYSQAGNAERVRARLMQTWPATLPAIEVVEQGEWFRLHSGPFGTRAEAAAAAAQLQDEGNGKVLVVQR